MAILVVNSISLYPLENSRAHHTDKYEMVHDEKPTPVFRRGEPFKLSIFFGNREYQEGVDKVRVIFNFGAFGEDKRGRRGGAWVTNAKELSKVMDDWSIRRVGQSKRTLTLEMRSPIQAAVGVYHISIKTSTRSSGEIVTFDDPQSVYILYNPWHKDDIVYMPKERLLDEYVLNDVGKIWVGPLGKSRGRQWVFGQFTSHSLKAAIILLNRTGLRYEQKGNPVMVTRAISKLVNTSDEDGGILTGSWEGVYEDGTAPSMWTGSDPILQEYVNTGGHEVKYGQCWVFAGVVTTICRAIGIPSRVVSNIVSAHDTNSSLTIDTYYSTDNEEILDPYSEHGEDSIWNFHVWNDVWMARPDLPSGYGGWQAVDATPQETSDGLFQCGPASVEAVRRGEIGFKYDVSFVLSSVNADLIKWKEDPDALLGFKRMDTNKYHVGRMILTKQPFIFDPNGDADREDITWEYKNPEGTKEERLAFYKAVQSNEIASAFYDMPDTTDQGVLFNIRDIDEIKIGEPFDIIVDMENVSNNPLTVEASLSAGTVYYTGVKANVVKKATGVFKLHPRSKEQIRLKITEDDYLEKLVEHSMMKIYAIATAKETKQTWAGEDDFQIMKPPLNIHVSDSIEFGDLTTMVFHFKNPLKKNLTDCKMIFEAPGILKHTKLAHRDVMPEENVQFQHKFLPQKAGEFKIVAIFHSKQLQDIIGSAVFNVL